MARALSDKTILVLREEASWGVYSGNSDIPHPFYQGNYGVTLKDPVRIQPVVDGSIETTFGAVDARDLDGPIEVPFYPDTIGPMLDWAFYRDATSGDGKSYSATIVDAGVKAVRDLGLKVDGGSINFADTDDLRMTLNVRGRYQTGVSVGSPGGLPVRGDYSWPAIGPYYFANCRFLISLDAAAGSPVEIVPPGLESGTLNFGNNLIPGQHVEDRADAEPDGALEWLSSGGKSFDGSFVFLMDREDFRLMQRDKEEVSLRIMATHRSATKMTLSGAVSAGDGVTINVDDSSSVVAGDVVMFHTVDTAKRSVATVLTVPGGTSFTCDLDKDVASGDLAFGKSMELYLSRGLVSEIPEDRSAGGVVKATLNFTTVSPTGTALIQYKGKGQAA